ncbi:primosomal protein N' ['Cynodon dactylon' phytoplasma]|nr:primosomal protein N' ['Cynodon dactylon' phytoplasma]
MFAEILLSIRKSNFEVFFDYIIPNNLISLAKIGMRVIVPFGQKNTLRLGYIINIKDQSNLANKYIFEIPDEEPFLNEELFLLVKEILQIPFISKTNAYSTIIPSGFLVTYKNKILPLQKKMIPIEIKDYLEKKKWFLNTKDNLLKTKKFQRLIKNNIVKSNVVIKNFYTKDKNIKIVPNLNEDISKTNLNSLLSFSPKCDEVYKKIDFCSSNTYLLYYFENQDKINFYLKIIEKNQKNQKQVLILVPEIIVINFLVKKIKDYFPYVQIFVLNSLLSKKENYIRNINIKEQKNFIVVGTRSAIFSPFTNLGTIIIDDEHDESLIEKDKINYDTRELAKIRSYYHKIPLILASNTPSLESYYYVKKNKYQFLDLSEKKNNFKMKLIDMKEELKNGNLNPFSLYLLKQISIRIQKKEKVLIFVNIRGFAPFILCRFCGYILKCSKCNISLVFFKKENILKCRFCRYSEKLTKKCLLCQKKSLKNVSYGIEYIESFLKKKFSDEIGIIRIDSDSISSIKDYEKIIKNLNKNKNKIDFLLGTEMICKKIDFPKVSLIGIMMADVLLNKPSFKSNETTFQLITQLAHHISDKNQIIVQSYDIEHYSIKNAANYNFQNFLENALKDRELSNNPPFVFLSQILIYNKNVVKLLKVAYKIKSILENYEEYNIRVIGPSFPRIFKKKYFYRVVLTLKYKNWPLDLDLVKKYIEQNKDTFIFFDFYANTV